MPHEATRLGPEMYNRLTRRLIADEGLRLKPYHCPAGKLTIGVGRNLDDRGLSHEEALYLLDNDIAWAESDLDSRLPWWRKLPPNEQEVLLCMVFNLGLSGLLGFRKMLAALQRRDVDTAEREMLDSAWAQQVGPRAHRMAALLRNGDP